MENKIPTAEELYNEFPHTVTGYISKGNCIAIARTLTRLHLEAQLKAIIENIKVDVVPNFDKENTGKVYLNKDSILNAYPLENVK